MTVPAGLDRLQEGYAYHNGRPIQLYSADDRQAAVAAFLKKCVNYSYGPLEIEACVDPAGPSASVDVSLFKVSLSECELSPENQSCRIGGAIAGFVAEIDAVLKENPWSLDISGTLCTPFAVCDKFSYVLPL